MGSQAHGHQPSHTSHSKKKTKKSSKHPQPPPTHHTAGVHAASHAHNLEEEEWCFISTPSSSTNHGLVTGTGHHHGDPRLPGVDHEPNKGNLALLDIMNKTSQVTARLLHPESRSRHGGSDTRRRPASRRRSDASIELDTAWSPVAGISNAYDNSDILAIGAWVQGNAPTHERAERSNRHS